MKLDKEASTGFFQVILALLDVKRDEDPTCLDRADGEFLLQTTNNVLNYNFCTPCSEKIARDLFIQDIDNK